MGSFWRMVLKKQAEYLDDQIREAEKHLVDLHRRRTNIILRLYRDNHPRRA